MAMVTRCPECATTFRVTPEQLQARQGQVRCGRCMTVFDGFRALTTEADATAAPPDSVPSAAPSPAHEPVSPGAVNTPSASQTVGTPVAADQQVERPLQAPGSYSGPPSAPLPPFDVMAESEPPVVRIRRKTWPWTAGTLALLILFAAQAGYAYRSELAASYPVLRPALARACDMAGCKVPLPQRPRLISIEASDLQIIDPARPQVIQLTATLRNHAGYEVGYPALDLVLTNTKEHTLARRIFMPEDYLERSRDPRAGIPASAEVTLRLDLDTGDLSAAGFRIDLLPAPAR
jgi:predicted Zn finger-like uncharacterized protein